MVEGRVSQMGLYTSTVADICMMIQQHIIMEISL